ncbi:Uncharacterized protein Rs2_03729 [Raphanus sativus]|nr:Uncharacterized protein Rs2_03729 [Raphanus sativus]
MFGGIFSTQSDAPKGSLMLQCGSSQHSESNDLTPAKDTNHCGCLYPVTVFVFNHLKYAAISPCALYAFRRNEERISTSCDGDLITSDHLKLSLYLLYLSPMWSCSDLSSQTPRWFCGQDCKSSTGHKIVNWT